MLSKVSILLTFIVVVYAKHGHLDNPYPSILNLHRRAPSSFGHPIPDHHEHVIPHPGYIAESYDSPSHRPNYEFNYEVRDEHTGDQIFHRESHDDNVVRGEFPLMEPNGSIRSVESRADQDSGFNAVVSTFGQISHQSPTQSLTAHQPPTQSQTADQSPTPSQTVPQSSDQRETTESTIITNGENNRNGYISNRATPRTNDNSINPVPIVEYSVDREEINEVHQAGTSPILFRPSYTVHPINVQHHGAFASQIHQHERHHEHH